MRPLILAALGSATLALSGTPVHAQDVSSATREEPPQQSDHVLLGLGVMATPAYQGSEDYRVLPIPSIDIAWGPFFANLRNGVGINAIDTSTFKVSASVAMMPGYRRKDVPDGVDRLKIGAGGRLAASLNIGGAILAIGGTKGFAGSTRGVIADASLAYPIVASPRFILFPAVGTTWGNRKHNDRYFGISRREALASGLPEYHLHGGFKDVSVGLTGSYSLTGHLNLAVSASAVTLLGDVRDAPIVRKRTQPIGFMSLSYRFGR